MTDNNNCSQTEGDLDEVKSFGFILGQGAFY